MQQSKALSAAANTDQDRQRAISWLVAESVVARLHLVSASRWRPIPSDDGE